MAFRERYGPWALIAGASEGIGAAYAHEAARRGLDVVLVARGREKLDATAASVAAIGVRVHVAEIDLASDDVVARLDEAVGDREIGLFVYNACHSVIGEFLDLSEADRERTIDVNVRAMTRLAAAHGAKMTARRRGGIVLMSSLSGLQGTAMVGIYAATKAYTTTLGEVLWEELGRSGVDVLTVIAGATLTPNFMAQTPEAVRATAYPGEPDVVACEGLDHLGRGPLWVPGAINRAVYHAVRHLMPRRAAVRFFSSNTRKMYDRGDS